MTCAHLGTKIGPEYPTHIPENLYLHSCSTSVLNMVGSDKYLSSYLHKGDSSKE